MTDHMMTRLHETHFGSSVNSIPCTVVHSPIEVSSLSPDQLHLTPISTIDGRTATGHERGRRSVVGGDGGGGGRPDGRHAEGGGRHIPVEGGVRHIQLASTRLFPLGAAAPIDRMPHVQFRSNPLTITPPSFPPSNVQFSVGPPSMCTFQAEWNDIRLRAGLLYTSRGIPEEAEQGESHISEGGEGVIWVPKVNLSRNTCEGTFVI